MSAMVYGNKRALLEDQMDPQASATPPVSKRFRRCSPSSSSPSPIRFPAPTAGPADRILALFPHINPQVLERALQECGNDVDAAIKMLDGITMGFSVSNVNSTVNSGTCIEHAPSELHGHHTDLVEGLVDEVVNSRSLEEARARATNALEVLEQAVISRAGVETIEIINKENMKLKEQMAVYVHENTILKRAVAIQHERQKEYEVKNQELQHLKQLVPQYQERIRVLEVNNYALTMHLRQAGQSNSWSGRINPDVF
ncbi:hypothetical protein SAY86_025865 [Trapa natans]|uniref:CUE domain-containing protein n=1 Tax=Trapa natans TaxID=22666 RepID=A0AAN7KCN6_TRANT|nr:hypothetical protein SAY86_025865 [Trapa natans]